MENKKGFTLIELLAVIVILGILMLIAIPSVTKYIDSSKKETYVKTISSMVDVVRYGVVSENEKYSMDGKSQKVFSLSQIELEKGSNKSPYGDLVEDYSYVVVTKLSDGYKYEVQVEDEGGFCIELISIDDLDEENIVRCDYVNIVSAPIYESYSVGDSIQFSGSNWYVIKDSSKSNEYVTLMKETVLTNDELGNYAYNSTYDTMEYTWTDTCHGLSHGYSEQNYSDCTNTNIYDNSKIKEMLETHYLPTLGSNNLKEIDGYKIRLITREELKNELGWASGMGKVSEVGNAVPTWVYQNFGDMSKMVHYYWTMSLPSYRDQQIWMVSRQGDLDYFAINNVTCGVRPVINLLKTSI